MREIKKIIIHCSDSDWGNALTIEQWHLERGFRTIGYHFVILNGNISPDMNIPLLDGQIECGRPIAQEGAHCKGQNHDSIGICMIGTGDFSEAQLNSLARLVRTLMEMYNLQINDVYGHYEFNPNKTCPCIDMNQLRTYIETFNL